MGCDGAVVGSWERRMGVRESGGRISVTKCKLFCIILATYLSFLNDYITSEWGH